MSEHVLGLRLNGELVRFKRVLTEQEFRPFVRTGLPAGWLAWHLDGDTDRRWEPLQQIPIVVGEDKPVDPIVALMQVDTQFWLRWTEEVDRETGRHV